MTAKGILVIAFAFLLGAAALAGEEHRKLVESGIDDGGQQTDVSRSDDQKRRDDWRG
jgi:hypothetical protein